MLSNQINPGAWFWILEEQDQDEAGAACLGKSVVGHVMKSHV